MKYNKFQLILFVCFLSLVNFHCYRMRKSNGGGQIETIPDRSINANDIGMHPGYKIESVASGFIKRFQMRHDLGVIPSFKKEEIIPEKIARIAMVSISLMGRKPLTGNYIFHFKKSLIVDKSDFA